MAELEEEGEYRRTDRETQKVKGKQRREYIQRYRQAMEKDPERGRGFTQARGSHVHVSAWERYKTG